MNKDREEFEERFTYLEDSKTMKIILWNWETDAPLIEAEVIYQWHLSKMQKQREELVDRVLKIIVEDWDFRDCNTKQELYNEINEAISDIKKLKEETE